MSEGSAHVVLAEAYRDESRGARACFWLSWLAWNMGDHENLTWWAIPAWEGGRNLRAGRRLLKPVAFVPVVSPVLVLVPFTGLGAAVGTGVAIAFLAAPFVGLLLGASSRPYRRSRTPVALVPRLPQGWRQTVTLVLGLSTGVLLRPTLVRLWLTPTTDYRTCRRSSVLDVSAALLSGVPAALLGLALGPYLLAVAVILAAWGVLMALLDGWFTMVKLTELGLLARRLGLVSFRRLLEDAAGRGVLTRSGDFYRFTDPSVRRVLAEAVSAERDRVSAKREQHAAARKQRAQIRAWRVAAAAASATGLRPRLLALLSHKAVGRLTLDVSYGGSAAFVAWWLFVIHSVTGAGASEIIALVIGFPILTLVGLVVGFAFLEIAFQGIEWLVGWSLLVSTRLRRMGRAVMWTGAGLLAGSAVWLIGHEAVRHGLAAAGVATLPAAAVAAGGGRVCVLAGRRFSGAQNKVVRRLPDAVVAVVAFGVVLLLIDRSLPWAQAFAAVLFPVMVRLCFRLWRRMSSSHRAASRAGADITFALALGAVIVLLLVWLANLLRMPPAELTVLHDAADRAGAVIDLPWWVWASVFGVLAGVSLTFARWPGRLSAAIRWSRRLRVVPSARMTSRVLTGVHIGLMVTVLIGVAAPVAVAPALRTRLAARYTVTLAGDFRARGELAAYRMIRRSFASAAPSQAAALAAIVVQIDAISKPSDSRHDATPTETDLARRLGELQALTLTASMGQSAQDQARDAARSAGFDGPLRDAADLAERTSTARAEAKTQDEGTRQADQAAELAAKTVTAVLGIPDLGHNEVLQVVREYLSGLVEDSPLTAVFAAWTGKAARRGGGSAGPLPATDAGVSAVVPDPRKLEAAAESAMNKASASMSPLDLLDTSGEMDSLLRKNPVVVAVDLVNQVRYLQEDTGPCEGCIQPEHSDDQPDHIDQVHVEP
jgi:hypothetical protein